MKVQTTKTGESSDSRFWDAMETIGSAEMMRQLNCGITQLIEEVMETGERGKLTLTLEVAKSKKERQLLIKPSVKVTKPTAVIYPCIAYADKDATLCNDDPYQGRLDLDDVPRRVSPAAVTAYRNSEVPANEVANK